MRQLLEHRPHQPYQVGPAKPRALPVRGPWLTVDLNRLNTVARLLIDIRGAEPGLAGRAIVKIEGRSDGKVFNLATIQHPAPEKVWQPDRVAIRAPYVRAVIASVAPDTSVTVRLDA